MGTAIFMIIVFIVAIQLYAIYSVYHLIFLYNTTGITTFDAVWYGFIIWIALISPLLKRA